MKIKLSCSDYSFPLLDHDRALAAARCSACAARTLVYSKVTDI